MGPSLIGKFARVPLRKLLPVALTFAIEIWMRPKDSLGGARKKAPDLSAGAFRVRGKALSHWRVGGGGDGVGEVEEGADEPHDDGGDGDQ